MAKKITDNGSKIKFNNRNRQATTRFEKYANALQKFMYVNQFYSAAEDFAAVRGWKLSPSSIIVFLFQIFVYV